MRCMQMGTRTATMRWCYACAAAGILTSAIVTGCFSPQQRPPISPYEIALGAAVDDPESLGWSTDGLDAIRQHAGSLGSAAVLIVTHGKVAFSYGDVGWNLRAHSIRKSFLSALYGIAIENGKIDPTQTLSELGVDDKTPLTEVEKRATVANLLAARSEQGRLERRASHSG